MATPWSPFDAHPYSCRSAVYAASTCSSPTNGDASSSSNGDCPRSAFASKTAPTPPPSDLADVSNQLVQHPSRYGDVPDDDEEDRDPVDACEHDGSLRRLDL